MYFDKQYLDSELKSIINDIIFWESQLNIHHDFNFVSINLFNLQDRKTKIEKLLWEMK